jgi:hypothetical protein
LPFFESKPTILIWVDPFSWRRIFSGPPSGIGEVHQAALQEFLWLSVPRDEPVGDWGAIVAATILLLQELGLSRLAEIARGRRTAQVLAAWEGGGKNGIAAFRSANEASGVQPSDTDVLAWRSVFGPDEAMAFEAVQRALGDAIADGELSPGRRGWRSTAASITERTLTQPLELPPGQSLAGLVVTERVRHWIDTARHTLLRDRRSSVANRLLSPTEAPKDAASVIAPFRWLLELASAEGGAQLSQSNYLPPAVIADAAERFGWWPWPKPPRSEADVHQIRTIRKAATRLHLTRRRGRKLHITSRGAHLLHRPPELWSAVASETEESGELQAMVTEIVALRLLCGPTEVERMTKEMAQILALEGWRTVDGKLATEAELSFVVWGPFRWWAIFDGVDDQWPIWKEGMGEALTPHTVSLRRTGEAMALAFLRERAVGPRRPVNG